VTKAGVSELAYIVENRPRNQNATRQYPDKYLLRVTA